MNLSSAEFAKGVVMLTVFLYTWLLIRRSIHITFSYVSTKTHVVRTNEYPQHIFMEKSG